MPEPKPRAIQEQVRIFISSNQNEFTGIRGLLEDALDGEDFFGLLLLKAEIVEGNRGSTIGGDMAAAIRRSSIYVGIFGRRYSKRTQAEYEEAKRRDLPALIFEVPSKKRDRNLKTLINRMKRVDDVRVMKVSKADMLGQITERIGEQIAAMLLQNKDTRAVLNPQLS